MVFKKFRMHGHTERRTDGQPGNMVPPAQLLIVSAGIKSTLRRHEDVGKRLTSKRDRFAESGQ